MSEITFAWLIYFALWYTAIDFFHQTLFTAGWLNSNILCPHLFGIRSRFVEITLAINSTIMTPLQTCDISVDEKLQRSQIYVWKVFSENFATFQLICWWKSHRVALCCIAKWIAHIYLGFCDDFHESQSRKRETPMWFV